MDKCRQSHFYVLLSSNLQWCHDWGVGGLSYFLAMRLDNARICVLSDLLTLSRLAPCSPKIGDPDQLDKLLMLMLVLMLTI